MTDQELIQALRYCGSETEYWCNGCPGERCCDEGGHDKILLDVADRLEALLAENERLKAGKDTNVPTKWVRARERFPDEGVRVLVYMIDAVNDYTSIDTDMRYKGKWVRWGRNVTHWMPLPSTEGVE